MWDTLGVAPCLSTAEFQVRCKVETDKVETGKVETGKVETDKVNGRKWCGREVVGEAHQEGVTAALTPELDLVS